ncbi:kinase-like protein [Rhizophagus irregularis]|nr:kinase-like protein [Rhizophagus irregularis]
MELANTTNDENLIDLTPRLKSSPIPIKFISFNKYDNVCIYCGEEYITTLSCDTQKYCKKCLSSYINDITDVNTYLDVYYTMNSECSEHEISMTKIPQSIQECCKSCLRIVYFKQICGYNNNPAIYDKVIESEKFCKLCGKSLYQGTDRNVVEYYKLCSDCYIIFSGYIESTFAKKQIMIFYLPWWHNSIYCDICASKLKFASDCQKHCTGCFIYYVGCRYCLTTNMVIGLTSQSQCKKCKNIISLILNDKEDFLTYNIIYYDNKLPEFANIVKNIDKYFIPNQILNSVKINFNKPIKWIPYSQFTDVKEMTKGGYGIIYIANWVSENKTVILKRFENSKNIGKYFLNELKSYRHFFSEQIYGQIIKIYGFTKDGSDDYILVLEYASGGDLQKYLQKNFTTITWDDKLNILFKLSEGLDYIHKNEFIHRDFHSGNILLSDNSISSILWRFGGWKIGDLGLSQSVDNKSTNNEVYGVIPYIAPEIFKGSKFSKEADIYSFGMVMWELTTGCKPFANVKHDIHLVYKILDGERPKITEDTPEFYANLMKSCWDTDPNKRPSIIEIHNIVNGFESFNSFDNFFNFIYKNSEIYDQFEAKRMELIQSKKIGPEKCHPGAIYTSRPLSALISKCSSTNSSTISFGNKQGYNYNYISEEQELDIKIESLSSQNLTIQNSLTSLNKRNIEESNLETHDNNGKRIKTNFKNICCSRKII